MEALQNNYAIRPDLLWLHNIFQQNKDIPFVKRLENRFVYPNLPWGQGTATHQLGYAEVGGKYIVYPEIELYQGKLTHLPNANVDPVRYALENKNYIEFENEKEADLFTKTYKKYWDIE